MAVDARLSSSFQEIVRPRKEEPDTYTVWGSISFILETDSGATTSAELANTGNELKFKASCTDALAKAVGRDPKDVKIWTVTDDPPKGLKVDYSIDFGPRELAAQECCSQIKASSKFAGDFPEKLVKELEVQGICRPSVSGVTTISIRLDIQHNVKVKCCTVM